MKAPKLVRKQTKKLLRKAFGRNVADNLDLRAVGIVALAYYGLRFLNKRGILPAQTGAALDLADRAIDSAKEALGIEEKPQKGQAA